MSNSSKIQHTLYSQSIENVNVSTVFHDKTFVDCSMFQSGWERCAPLHSFGPATRNHYLFHYIINGQGTLVAADSKGFDYTYHLRTGQGFLISPKQRTHYFADEHNPWEYTWLEFDGLKAQEFLTLAGLSVDDPVYISNVPNMQRTVRDELLYIAHHGEESSLNLIGHMYLFLDALQKSSNRRKATVEGKLRDFYVREAINFVENNYFNDISVEDIARFCNLNRSYFGKLFREVAGTTPQEFLIRYRMTKACEFLETSNDSIGKISQMVGYPSQLHFSRSFKKTLGMSPREWRKHNFKK